jgi:hypothetical protein
MTVFGNMVDSLTQTKSVNAPVTPEQYQQWKQQYSFDGLKDLRYGQSFCNHFNIRDNILFYSHDAESADDYIRKLYVL